LEQSSHLYEAAKACRALADKLVPSPERDALLLKARQAETASQFVKRAFPSPGLQGRDKFRWAQRR
jgi:hypothetical protein